MFNYSPGEVVFVMMLALVVLGPEKLPGAMRKVGQVLGELRKISSGFKSEFNAMVDEPARELRETAAAIRDSADFSALVDGERATKPPSATMPDLGGAPNESEPATPSSEPPADAAPADPSEGPA